MAVEALNSILRRLRLDGVLAVGHDGTSDTWHLMTLGGSAVLSRQDVWHLATELAELVEEDSSPALPSGEDK